MADNRGSLRHYAVHAGRDALVAGRDINVQYVTYNRTWSDGVAQPPLTVGSSPYRGLSPFRQEDEALFFGRERATAGMLGLLSDRLGGPGLLVVSGVSGAGKSSLLRAGVLPGLRRQGLAAAPAAGSWPCLVLNPSDSPLEELADALSVMLRVPASELRAWLAADPANFTAIARQAALAAPPHGRAGSGAPGQRSPRLLLIVDQCEKLFTQCTQEQRHAFLQALYAASAAERARGRTPAAMVVLAIRSDFEARLAEYHPAEFPQLGQAVQDRFLLRAMSERELRLAITGPAGKAGFRVGESLVETLLAEMRASAATGGQAIGSGTLPLLSYALDQAWRARGGRDLELADYERTGGIQRAVGAAAQRAYDLLSAAQQRAARTVFTRLVATGRDGADTAIRLPVADLTASGEPGDVDAVLEAFASRRLLTMAAGTVEISHESLLTAWPLLRDSWLAETRADRIVRTRLHATAAEWDNGSRDPSYLYRGTVLQEAGASTRRIDADPVRNPPLTRQERDFLAASTRAARRSARRVRAAFAVFTVLTVAASVLAAVALYNAADLRRQGAIALSRQLAADSLAADPVNLVAARQLAVAATHVYPTDQAKAAMLTLVAEQQQGTLPITANSPVSAVAFSPDGKTLAAAGADGTVRLWDLTTGQPTVTIAADTTGKHAGVSAVAFSPDGDLVATADANGLAQLWNAATGNLLASIPADTTGTYTGPNGAALRPRGTAVDGAAFVGVSGVAFSPDGKLLATADGNGMAQLWDAATDKLDIAIPVDTKGTYIGVQAVAFSPDGTVLATAGDNGTVQLWKTSGGSPDGLLDVNSQVAQVAFGPGGKTLVTADTDYQAFGSSTRLWDLATDQPIASFPAHPPTSPNDDVDVQGVAFSPDGKLVATADGTGMAQLWNASSGKLIASIPANTTGAAIGVQGVAFSPDGKLLATADRNGTARLWSVSSAGAVPALSADVTISANDVAASGGRMAVQGVAFSPDGKVLATPDANGTVGLWNASTGTPIGSTALAKANGAVGVAFSPDGKTLATAGGDGTAQLWNASTRRLIVSIRADTTGSATGLEGVAFSPNGKLLATADADGTARLWNATTGTPLGSTDASKSSAEQGVAFSPNSKLLATAGATAQLWNPATGKLIASDPAAPAAGVEGIAFSPDGTLLATANGDGAAQLWDVASGQPVGNPLISSAAGSEDGMNGVAFSPDGTLLATADADGTVQLWDTVTGQLIASYQVNSSGADAVAFSPDGRQLAVANGDGTVQLWATPLSVSPYLVLCSEFGPPTRGEWQQYASGEPFTQAC